MNAISVRCYFGDQISNRRPNCSTWRNNTSCAHNEHERDVRRAIELLMRYYTRAGGDRKFDDTFSHFDFRQKQE